mmetsp:Transcript_13617/g.47510  ORF Transcript_13617/g.47510 Transcript_13617/m.47510 type:complete len:290 (-) Transcript_13617:139-1008(-)
MSSVAAALARCASSFVETIHTTGARRAFAVASVNDVFDVCWCSRRKRPRSADEYAQRRSLRLTTRGFFAGSAPAVGARSLPHNASCGTNLQSFQSNPSPLALRWRRTSKAKWHEDAPHTPTIAERFVHGLTLLHGCAAPPAPRNHVPRRWLSQYSANVRAASARPLKTRPIASSPVALKLTSLSTSSTRGARPALIKRSCSRRATALRFLSPAALTTLFSSTVFAPPRPRCRRRCISPSMSDSSKSSSEVSSCAIARNAASLLSATLVSSRACIWDTAAAGSPDTRLRI